MNFSDLNLNSALRNALTDLEFTVPTTIQYKVFAPIMAGNDVLGIAQTGTGKTFAYLLPILRMWQYSKLNVPEVLILVPTRELVAQVVEDVQKLVKYTSIKVTGAYGETNIKTQIKAINQGVDIVVGTPGRLIDLILHGTLKPRYIKKIVIDEVDEMLTLGFQKQLETIFDLIPNRRQTLMFSATVTEDVEKIISENFRSPMKIEAAPAGTPLKNITQFGYTVPNFYTKVNLLQHLLRSDEKMTKVLVFASTKILVDDINVILETEFPDQLSVIHSNKSQNFRFKSVADFENGASRILIATDIVARGLDVTAVSHVVNMDVPEVPEHYIHRIGRTGRADKKGISITLITPAEKEKKLEVESLMGRKISMKKLPEELEISTILRPEEIPKVMMKNIVVRASKQFEKGEAFTEKMEKNKKINKKITREAAMKKKYGKRFQKKKSK
jgi:ATP-dependent RNA helicase RhlE